MVTQEIVAGPSSGAAAAGAEPANAYLFHPVVDFLLLGGGSIVLMVLFLLIDPPKAAYPALIAVSVIVAHFINHPHFANSYQIFYRNYRRKAFGGDGNAGLRVRYVVAGIIVPVLLIGTFFQTLLFLTIIGFLFNFPQYRPTIKNWLNERVTLRYVLVAGLTFFVGFLVNLYGDVSGSFLYFAF